MRLLGCQYCRKGRAFWAYDSHGSPGLNNSGYQNAHIEAGTNIFHDTAGRAIRFRYCPMCGKSLLDTPDIGGGSKCLVSIFPPLKSSRRILTEHKEL